MTTDSPSPEPKTSGKPDASVWALRVVSFGAFGALMTYEWLRWPNGSAWLGPLGFFWYFGPNVEGLAITLTLLPLVFAFPLKPHPVTALLSLLGLMAWACMGTLAQGIGC